jgi:hypothetical protein
VMMTKRRVSYYDFFPSQGTLYFFQSLVRFHALFILENSLRISLVLGCWTV